MSEAETNQTQRRRTPVWEWVALTLVGLTVVVVFALPPVIRWAATDWLQKQGAEEVRIEAVRLNLFRGQAALEGLYVREGDHAPLEVGKLGVTFAWRALLDRRAEVTDVSLDGAVVPIVVGSAGDIRVGFALPRPGEKAESEPEPEAESEPWGFALRSVRIDNSQISLQMPSVSGSWHLQHLILEDLVSWQPGESASLQIDSRLNNARLDVQADLQPFASPMLVQARVQVDAFDLGELSALAGDQLKSIGGQLQMDMNVQVEQQDGALRVRPDGTLQLRKVRVVDPQGREVETGVRWSGRADVQLRDSLPSAVADGTLVLTDSALRDRANDVSLQLGRTEWNGNMRYGMDAGGQTVTLKGGLNLQALGAAQGEQVVRLGSLQWQTQSSVNIAKAGDTRLKFSGPLQLREASVDLPDHALALGDVLWDGSGEVALGEEIVPQVRGALQADAFSLLQKNGSLQLARLDTLRLEGVQVEGLQQQTIDSVALRGLFALQSGTSRRPEVVRLGSLKTATIQRRERLVEVGLVELQDLVVDILRDQQGQIATVTELQAPGSGAGASKPAMEPGAEKGEASVAEADKAEVTEPAPPLQVIARGLRVGGDSRLRFADRKVEPRFTTEYQIEKLEVGALDTASPATETPVEMVLKTPGGGQVVLKGSGTVLEDPLSLQLTVTGRALELANLSPYTIQTIGYEFGTGQLNLDTEVKVVAGKIDGENKIHLRRFTMEKANASAAEKLARNLTMPLDSALSLLRDSDGDIKLKIPLSGDLAKPEVDVQDAINQALGKALRKAAFGYLKHTLQPYGSIITVVEVLGAVGEKLTALKLAPVEFQAGAVAVGATGQEYLGKVAGLLKQRPELTLKLCGLATPADQAALQAAGGPEDGGADASGSATEGGVSAAGAEPLTLREIAELRSLHVKNVLVEDMGVKAGQLFLCAPQVLENNDEKPSVQMQV